MNIYKDITYTLTKSNRKTASIYIERDCQVSVLVPETLTDVEVNRLIETKRRWIYRNLAEWQDTNAPQYALIQMLACSRALSLSRPS